MISKLDLVVILGAVLIVLGLVVFVGGSVRNETNSTLEMKLGDRWDCGYINTTTTLDQIRNCFRD